MGKVLSVRTVGSCTLMSGVLLLHRSGFLYVGDTVAWRGWDFCFCLAPFSEHFPYQQVLKNSAVY